MVLIDFLKIQLHIFNLKYDYVFGTKLREILLQITCLQYFKSFSKFNINLFEVFFCSKFLRDFNLSKLLDGI